MQIVCPACSKRLQIAEDKLPADRQVRIACPSCQERFTFDAHSIPATDASQTFAIPTIIPPPGSGAGTTGVFPPTPTLNIDIVETGPAPRALVCLDTPSHRDKCASMFPVLGYNTVHVMNNQVQALTQLTQVTYDCVILDILFDGSTEEGNPVLACIAALPMQQRRHMFVALCDLDMESGDMMAAYSQSVNLVINHAEILSCRRSLEQHITMHERSYRGFNEIRQELGKD